MKSLAQTIALIAMAAAAGCSANTGNNSVNIGDADTAIFQPKQTSVSGSAVGLIGTKTIALTYDDGPKSGLTDDLLNYLQAQGVKASFYMVGKNIIGNEYLLQRMADQDMSLGNHTYDHKPIVKMSKTDMNGVYKQIAETDALITPHLRRGKHIYFRSPGGSWTSLIADAMNRIPEIAEKYIGPVFWDVGGTTVFEDLQGNRIVGEAVKYDANAGLVTLVRRGPGGAVIKKWTEASRSLHAAADWDCSVPALNIPVEMCADGYIKEIERRQGGIVLLHDTHAKTIEMSKIIIPRLKQLGYKFITMDEIPNIEKFE